MALLLRFIQFQFRVVHDESKATNKRFNASTIPHDDDDAPILLKAIRRKVSFVLSSTKQFFHPSCIVRPKRMVSVSFIRRQENCVSANFSHSHPRNRNKRKSSDRSKTNSAETQTKRVCRSNLMITVFASHNPPRYNNNNNNRAHAHAQ